MSTASTVPVPAREMPPETPPVSAFRLLATLGLAGALSGLLLVIVFQLTQPRIQAHKARVLKAAVLEVLAGPESYETLYVVDGVLVAEAEAGTVTADLPRVYAGRDAEGRLDGFAVPAAKPGFQDVISLIFGYDAATGTLRGMKVLENKETPGLGDAIEKSAAFTGQFSGRSLPLVGVKKGAGSGATTEIDTITGATISSKTVIAAINQALDVLRPLMDARHAQEGSR